jgi:hypothetical protein
MSPWIFPVDGQWAAHGRAVLRPLALDLAIITSTWNGNWDRDNVGLIKIDASKGSTIVSPFASKLGGATTVVTPGTAQVALRGSGRQFLTGTGLQASHTGVDGTLLVTFMLTVRVDAAAMGAGYLPVNLAVGVMVDGDQVWWSGWETVTVMYDGVGAGRDVDVSFARATVRLDIGAGTHTIQTFVDYERQRASAAAADVAIRIEPLERCLILEEVRR